MGVVTEIGNQISRGVQSVSNSMNAPDYYKWAVVPFFITFILVAVFLGRIIYKNFTSVTTCKEQKIVEEEDTVEKVCNTEAVTPMFRVLTIILIAVILSSIIGGAVYKTVLYIKNPKTAMAIETTRIVRNVFK